MNSFSAIDQFIFGPSLDFATATRYPVGESVDRIRSVTMPRWMTFPRFRRGLYGNVDPDRVAVGWHNPWMRDGFQPWFVGRFFQDAAGLRLAGSIGFPVWQKVMAYSITPVWIVVEIFLNSVTGAPIWLLAIVPVLFAAGLLTNTVMRRNDAQAIADALDAALA
jgi:hypothetical protein